MSEDYARKVRRWLGDFNDPDEPVQTLVQGLSRQLAEAQEKLRWRQCETEMPKPGQHVLARYTNSNDLPRTIRAYWIPKRFEESDADFGELNDYCDATDSYYAPEGWYELIDQEVGEYGAYLTNENITRWLPLPPDREGE